MNAVVCAQALGLLEEMERRGVSADLVTYNTAIDAVGKAGQHERALGLLREVEKRGTTCTHYIDELENMSSITCIYSGYKERHGQTQHCHHSQA